MKCRRYVDLKAGVCNKNFSGANFRAPNLALALKPARANFFFGRTSSFNRTRVS